MTDHDDYLDRLRALDETHAPDWSAVEHRLERPAGSVLEPADHRSHPNRALVAAVLVLAVAAASSLALTSRDEPRHVATTAPTAPNREPSDAWGSTWALTRFTVAGSEISIPGKDAVDPGTLLVVLDLSRRGTVRWTGCNGGGGEGRIDGVRLVIDKWGTTTVMGCGGDTGRALEKLDTLLGSFFRSEPVVQVEGQVLTFTAGSDVARFERLPATLTAGALRRSWAATPRPPSAADGPPASPFAEPGGRPTEAVVAAGEAIGFPVVLEWYQTDGDGWIAMYSDREGGPLMAEVGVGPGLADTSTASPEQLGTRLMPGSTTITHETLGPVFISRGSYTSLGTMSGGRFITVAYPRTTTVPSALNSFTTLAGLVQAGG